MSGRSTTMLSHAADFGLSERDLLTIRQILLTCPDIGEARIFGSRAKGTHHPGSDIDLAIMNQGVDDRTLMRVAGAFEESSLPFRVDVVYFPDLGDADLKDHIIRVGRPIFPLD